MKRCLIAVAGVVAGLVIFSLWWYRGIPVSNLVKSTSVSMVTESSDFSGLAEYENDLVSLLMSYRVKRGQSGHYDSGSTRIHFVGGDGDKFMNLIVGEDANTFYLEYRTSASDRYTIYKVVDSEVYCNEILMLVNEEKTTEQNDDVQDKIPEQGVVVPCDSLPHYQWQGTTTHRAADDREYHSDEEGGVVLYMSFPSVDWGVYSIAPA